MLAREPSPRFPNPAEATMALIDSKSPFDIDLGLHNTHVVVTGGCGLIGRVVVRAFLSAGARVTIIDLNTACPFDLNDSNLHYAIADITNIEQMDKAFEDAEQKFGPVETCVALASLDLSVLKQSESLADMDPTTWQRTFDVNINGTFMTCQRWLRSIRNVAADADKATRLRNVSLVIVGLRVRTVRRPHNGRLCSWQICSPGWPST